MSQSQDAVGFDTNHLDPGLAAIFPREVEIVDLASTRGQMALFDRLIEDDKSSKVVDLWHVSYERFFRQAEDIGFFQEAQARAVKCDILLQTDPRRRFAHELTTLPGRCPGAAVLLVENEELAGFSADPDSQALDGLHQRRFFVPKLDPAVRHVLNCPDLLLRRFISMWVPDDLRTIQHALSRSLQPIFSQFEILALASDLGLPVRSLLPRKPSRPP